MPVPLIGVTTRCNHGENRLEISQAYLQAVLHAGGLPLLLPMQLPEDALGTALCRLDGLLLTGGGDIAPQLFGGKASSKVYGIDVMRDTLEITLVQALQRRNLPVLCICRGIQVLNVAFGGTLFTDILEQVPGANKHDFYPDWPQDRRSHEVSIEPGSKLAQIFGKKSLEVNSMHHQSIDRVAEELQVIAYSPDGIVEAVELKNHPFFVGVQWHPECLPDDKASQEIFSAFVQAAIQP